MTRPAVPQRVSTIAWTDLPPPIQRRLTATGLAAPAFAAFVAEGRKRTQARVREGDLDALVYFALQSTSFTSDPPIEPALSAKGFVERLSADSRKRYLAGNHLPVDAVPAPVVRRLAAMPAALRNPPPHTRLAYFAEIVSREAPGAADVQPFLRREYVRAMRFLYEKEFEARGKPPASLAALYHERGLSTDTAVEAGYLVHLGLATLRASDPGRRIRRVLIVGPGLDLAPRTGLLDAVPPESYQPYTVLDSLIALGLARPDAISIAGADVNPRVVDHLRLARDRDVSLTLVSGIADSATVTLDDEYRRYFQTLGATVGEAAAAPALPASYRGHLRKSIRVPRRTAAAIDGLPLDISTERLDEGSFDLVVATNVFPYMDDAAFVLAMTNITAMLAAGGALIHNESRPVLAELAAELGLPLAHARTAAIASVRGAQPLYDAVFVHTKASTTVAPKE